MRKVIAHDHQHNRIYKATSALVDEPHCGSNSGHTRAQTRTGPMINGAQDEQ